MRNNGYHTSYILRYYLYLPYYRNEDTIAILLLVIGVEFEVLIISISQDFHNRTGNKSLEQQSRTFQNKKNLHDVTR